MVSERETSAEQHAPAETGSARSAAWIAAHAEGLMLAAILAALAARFALASRLAINWDEFHFLSDIYAYLRGTLAGRFQTFYVHFFTWLTGIGGAEIGQVIAGRLIMAAAAAGSAGLIYALARRFVAREAALFGVLAYLSVGAVVAHGADFRYDPLATLLVLAAAFTLLRRPGGTTGAALAGAIMALALLVTIKSVFYLAADAAAIGCLDGGWRRRGRLALAFSAGFAPVFAALFAIHGASLSAGRNGVSAAAASVIAKPALARAIESLSGIAAKVFGDGLLPRPLVLAGIVLRNPLFWLLLAEGAIVAALHAFRTRRAAPQRWLPLALALPLLTPLIYRNSFAYFYVFILPPAVVLIALAYERHRRRAVAEGRPAALALLVAALAGFLVYHYGQNLPDRIAPQRRVIAAVHRIFPQPVPYIDGYGVVAGFPHVGPFLSSWGLEAYRRAGRPIFARLAAKNQPPLLLADSPSLAEALLPGSGQFADWALLPADIHFLKNNYRQYWGMVFVAGKSLSAPSGGTVGFAIAVAGRYRLDGAAPVAIDGRRIAPGAVVRLAVGEHGFAAGGKASSAVLRWADLGPPPAAKPVGLLRFYGR